MNRINLLAALKERHEEVTGGLILPTRIQKGEEDEARAPLVFTARLPDSTSSTRKAPYIVNSVLNSKFKRLPGNEIESRSTVRTVFCAYCTDQQKGGMMLLDMMERVRISLMKNPILDGTFELDMETGIEDLVYPDDTAPFYMGEMITEWKLPPVEREDWKVWLK